MTTTRSEAVLWPSAFTGWRLRDGLLVVWLLLLALFPVVGPARPH